VALRRPPSAATPASPDPPASREPEPDPELELDDPEPEPEEAEPELDELDTDPELDPEPVLEPVWVPELEPEPVALSYAASPPTPASVRTTLPSIHPAELVAEQDQLKLLVTSAKRAAECPDRPRRLLG
jgi:hypothetical protein